MCYTLNRKNIRIIEKGKLTKTIHGKTIKKTIQDKKERIQKYTKDVFIELKNF